MYNFYFTLWVFDEVHRKGKIHKEYWFFYEEFYPLFLKWAQKKIAIRIFVEDMNFWRTRTYMFRQEVKTV